MAVLRVFALTLLSCAWVHARNIHNNDNVGIIGGLRVKIEEAPYMAGLVIPGYADSAGKWQKTKAFGTGSIIHEQFILTSASVMKEFNGTSQVLVGTDRLFGGGQLINVSDHFCHEKFCDDPDYDICLLKLRNPVKLGPKVAKIYLPDQDVEFESGTSLNVTGWGMMNDHNEPDHLRRARIELQDSSLCASSHRNMTVNMLCVGDAGHGPYVGDGGAPLTFDNMQIGLSRIVGKPAEPGSSVFTKVSKFVFWIDDIISKKL